MKPVTSDGRHCAADIPHGTDPGLGRDSGDVLRVSCTPPTGSEKPVLNGGVQVTGWTQHSGNIWQAQLNRDDKLRALYVNGKRALCLPRMSSALVGGVYRDRRSSASSPE